MLILAMAPPVPSGEKLLIAFFMLGLAGWLVRARSGSSFTGRSIALSMAATLGMVLVAEALLPRSFGEGLHDRGLLAAGFGALAAAGLLRPAYKVGYHVPSSSKHLARVSLITGPLVGLILASLTVLFTEVPPLDRSHTFRVFVVIGVMAGVLGAAIVALVRAVGSLRSTDSDRQD